jgi:hypothetical protein
VYEQLRTGKPRGLLEIGNVVVLIKSRFFRAINRRFHAAHFWPECVSGKLDQMDRWESLARHLRRRVREKTSPRDRWFGFPDPHYGFEGARLDGRDVSSSQTQILAILLGLDELERLAGPAADKSFKFYLAEEVWRAHREGRLPLRDGFAGPTDLVQMAKTLWTRVLYGGKLREIVWDNPGWIAGDPPKEQYPAAVSEAERHLSHFLESLPWHGKRGDRQVGDFFHACRRIARVAITRGSRQRSGGS